MHQPPDFSKELHAFLLHSGLAEQPFTLAPVVGGVSSEVWRVDSGLRTFIVKRSVPKLRVRAEWFSDPARLRYEFLYLQTAAEIDPTAVPALLLHDLEAPFIAMEFLGPDFQNWKSLLLAGHIAPRIAAQAGHILGRIHAATTANATVRARFDTMEFFTQLRLDAYLRTTAEKQSPQVANAIQAEADRLASHHECLVHGDYSPKNMMTSPHRFVILDCETACYGDPAFDLAFLLNHLLLKALYHTSRTTRSKTLPLLSSAVASFRDAYADAHPTAASAIESRTAHLLPMLLLARVDGKSPVEYLEPHHQNHVRISAPPFLLEPSSDLSSLIKQWFADLPSASA